MHSSLSLDRWWCVVFSDKMFCFGFQGSWRWDISRDSAKTCMHLRLAIRGQEPMTPTVMSWVWQVDSKESVSWIQETTCVYKRSSLGLTSVGMNILYTWSMEATRMFRLAVDSCDVRGNDTEPNGS